MVMIPVIVSEVSNNNKLRDVYFAIIKQSKIKEIKTSLTIIFWCISLSNIKKKMSIFIFYYTKRGCCTES